MNHEPAARARNADPRTSHLAAASVTDHAVSVTKRRILAVIEHGGPGTRRQIVERYRQVHPLDKTTDESIRSRVAELMHDTPPALTAKGETVGPRGRLEEIVGLPQAPGCLF